MARGSQLQVQIYVNRRPGDLSAAVLDALPTLARRTRKIGWTAPLEHEGYAEPQDADFLRAVGRADLVSQLQEFWPARGPVWDAVGIAIFAESRPGVLLAEGKSYPGEFRSGGARAGDDSLKKIEKALEETRQWLGVDEASEAWTGDLYQSANRLAHLYWLREIVSVEAWLVHLLFTDDHTHRAATREEWKKELPKIDNELGLTSHSEWASHAFLPALAATELTREPSLATGTGADLAPSA